MKNSKDKQIKQLDFDQMWQQRQDLIKVLPPDSLQGELQEETIQDFISFLPLPNAFSMKDLKNIKLKTLRTLRDLSGVD